LPDYPIIQDSDVVNHKIAAMQSQEIRRDFAGKKIGRINIKHHLHIHSAYP